MFLILDPFYRAPISGSVITLSKRNNTSVVTANSSSDLFVVGGLCKASENVSGQSLAEVQQLFFTQTMQLSLLGIISF
jgi:hypothetical protein